MNDALALNAPSLSGRIKTSKRKTIKRIEQQLMASKLEILKAELREKEIPFDDSITDYYAFIDHLRNTLDGDSLSVAAKLVEDSNSDVEEMVRELKEGSSSSFTKFVTNHHTFNPRTALEFLASGVLLIGATPAVQILGFGILASVATNKISKMNNMNLVKNKELELNKIIQDLEVTRDPIGRIIDTRFDEATIALIKQFFEENNIRYTDTGYLSLRQAIDDLDNVKKEALCRYLNQAKGNPIDISDRLKGYSIKSNTAKISTKKKVITGTLGAAGVFAANALLPGLGGALLSGPIAGLTMKKLTGSKAVGWITGLCAPLLSLIVKYGPVLSSIGSVSLTNIGVMAIAGLGALALAPLGVGLIKAIKNRRKRFSLMKDQEEICAIDNQKYRETDAEEMTIMEEMVRNKSHEQELIITATCRYMDEMEIPYGGRPRTFNDLKMIIESLDRRDKRRVYSFLNSFDEYVKGEPNFTKKVGNAIKSATAIGLSPLASIKFLGIGDKVREKMEKNNAESLISVRPAIEETPHEETPEESTAPEMVEGAPEESTTPEIVEGAPEESTAPEIVEGAPEESTAPEMREEITTPETETTPRRITLDDLEGVNPLEIQGLPNIIDLALACENSEQVRNLVTSLSTCSNEQLVETIDASVSPNVISSNTLNLLDPATYERFKSYILTIPEETLGANPKLQKIREAYVINATERFEHYKRMLMERAATGGEEPTSTPPEMEDAPGRAR